MIQVQTELNVADNTGARVLECIKVLGGSKRRYAWVGDRIVVSVKEAIPNGKVKKVSVHRAVIVRTKFSIHRNDGSKVKFDNIATNPQNCKIFQKSFKIGLKFVLGASSELHVVQETDSM